MTMLTRHEMVLDTPNIMAGTVSLSAEVDEPESDTIEIKFFVTITRELWEEMGSPQTVTVTIEPGDNLNS